MIPYSAICSSHCREHLAQQPEVYFEAGDHEALIHMTQDEFLSLMETAERAHFSHKMQGMWVS